MKKMLTLTLFALSHLFHASAHAESTTIEPSLPQNISSWLTKETTCDKHPGKRLLMKSYLLRSHGEIAIAITTISLNGEKVVQSEAIIKMRENTFENIRVHVINSKSTPLQYWTKFEFRLGDSRETANTKILNALGVTQRQFTDCNF